MAAFRLARTKNMYMKQLSLAALFFSLCFQIQAQHVGIGTIVPKARLHVKDSSVLFTGADQFVDYAPVDLPPVSGPGTRLMWMPSRGAFRSGWVENNRWDRDSIGIFSVAMGHSNLALNTGSVSMGIRNNSYGFAAASFGYGTTAFTDYSFSAGYLSAATGYAGVAIGNQSIASGGFSAAMGSQAISSGTGSIALGDSALASGYTSFAAGSHVFAKATGAFTAGWYNDNSDTPPQDSYTPTDRIFQIGNGNGFLQTRSNAVTVLRNGSTGIGTVSPAASAILDISSNNRGVLISRVALSDVAVAAPVSSPATGLLIYNTNASVIGGSGAGFYYWTGSNWTQISTTSGTAGAWGLNGNSGTSASNYIGTNDAQDLRFIVSGMPYGFYNVSNSNTAIGANTLNANITGSNNTAYGNFSLQANTDGALNTATGNGSLYSNISGIGNTSTGAFAMQLNTTGGFNTAVGYSSLNLNTTGGANTAVGNNSLAGNNTGALNSAFGDLAMKNNTTGAANTAIGFQSLVNNITGSTNTALGANADVLSPGLFNATAVGSNAKVAISDALVLGSTGVKVGIGTSSPLNALHVADSSVLFSAPATLPVSPSFNIPSGGGNRFLWYADKAAMRAGGAAGSEWDRNSIGAYSFGSGFGVTASDQFSFSTGFGSASTYTASFSAGVHTSSQGIGSASFGEETFAKARAAFTVGSYNDATDNPSPSGIVATDRIFQIGNGSAAGGHSNAMTILRNGNVGIGNLNPLTPLAFNSVVGNKISLYTTNATAQYGIGLQSGLLQFYTDIAGASIAFGSGSSNSFSERMRINNSGTDGMVLSGRVLLKSGTGLITDVPGVWTYKPDNSALLGFMGTQNSTNIGFFSGITNQWGLVFDAANMRVGIGTSTPSQALNVAGNILATGTITPSDARYKKNITPIEQPLEKLQRLNGVTYNYRSEEFPDMKFPDATQVGLIAQEVEKVYPQLVFTDDKGYKAVDYVKLIPLLIESAKVQQKEIEELKMMVEKLVNKK